MDGRQMTSPIKDFFSGVGMLGRGLAIYARSPGMVVLGVIPALLTGAVLLTAWFLLLYFIGDIASGVTWFADHWSTAAKAAVRLIAGVAIVLGAAVLSVITFTALTLAIGDPFYEKISEQVEARLGGAPDAVGLPWYREMWRAITESLRMVLVSTTLGVLLFAAGFIPAAGQTVVPVIGAFVGGWFLALELTGVAFARRGKRLAERRRVLRQHRAMALGFGVCVFVCFLIPLGAVLLMPAAVAGGTLLTRQVLEPGPAQAPAAGLARSR